MEKEVAGFHARVLQHEIDHLDGVIILDHLEEGDRVAHGTNPTPRDLLARLDED